MSETRSTLRRPRKKQSPAEMVEEINRIQGFLRLLDEKIEKDKENNSIKDLIEAVQAACDGGRSIAQIRRAARELIAAMEKEENDEDRQMYLNLMGEMGAAYENLSE